MPWRIAELLGKITAKWESYPLWWDRRVLEISMKGGRPALKKDVSVAVRCRSALAGAMLASRAAG